MTSRGLKFAAFWSSGLLAALVIAMISGIALLPLLAAAICIIMMALIYGESQDILDARAAFFLSTFTFIAAPSIFIAADFAPDEPIWYVVSINNLSISHSDFDFAQRIIFLGLLAVTVPMLAHIAGGEPPPPNTTEPRSRPIIWLVYLVILVAYFGVTYLQYGGIASILHYATDPVARLGLGQGGQLLAGISAILAFASEVSAYYLCRRLRVRIVGVIFFVPILFCLLAEANRGVLMVCMLVALFAIVDLRMKRPFLLVVLGFTGLPFVATSLVNFRNTSVNTTQPQGRLFDAYRQFFTESNMVIVMAKALRGLHDGVINYSYGIDLLSFPGWYVPRILWPGKPLPLDFRLNNALSLNDGDVFGTPVTLFGGVYINFTPVLYIFALVLFSLLVIGAYRRLRDDRLLKVFFLVFVLDIVRVGDLSREAVTFSLSLGATLAIRWLVLPRTDAATSRTESRAEVRGAAFRRADRAPTRA